jgi:hypothetical protein
MRVQSVLKQVAYAEAWALREELFTNKKEDKKGEEKDFVYFPSQKEGLIRRRAVA